MARIYPPPPQVGGGGGGCNVQGSFMFLNVNKLEAWLVRIMVCSLFGVKPLFELVVTPC